MPPDSPWFRRASPPWAEDLILPEASSADLRNQPGRWNPIDVIRALRFRLYWRWESTRFSKGTPWKPQRSSRPPFHLPQEWKDLLEDLLPPQGEWSENKYLVLTDHRNRLVEFTEAAGTTYLEKWQGTWVETACEWKEEGVFLTINARDGPGPSKEIGPS